MVRSLAVNIQEIEIPQQIQGVRVGEIVSIADNAVILLFEKARFSHF